MPKSKKEKITIYTPGKDQSGYSADIDEIIRTTDDTHSVFEKIYRKHKTKRFLQELHMRLKTEFVDAYLEYICDDGSGNTMYRYTDDDYEEAINQSGGSRDQMEIEYNAWTIWLKRKAQELEHLSKYIQKLPEFNSDWVMNKSDELCFGFTKKISRDLLFKAKRNLQKLKCLDDSVTKAQFESVFDDKKPFDTLHKIDWKGTLRELKYFVEEMQKKSIIEHPKDKHWVMISEMFSVDGKNFTNKMIKDDRKSVVKGRASELSDIVDQMIAR